jgi:hypothetical protein
MRGLLRPLILLLALLAPGLAPAQEEDDGSRLGEIRDLLSEPAGGPGQPVLFPDLPANFEPDAATLAAIQTAVQGYYGYRSEAFRHRSRIFYWQFLSSQAIFVVVVVIVFIGLYFSWIQFRADLRAGSTRRRRPETEAEVETGSAPPGVTTFEAGAGGIKVSSPVLGVIILTLSLAFFYLYLRYVYPVTDVF